MNKSKLSVLMENKYFRFALSVLISFFLWFMVSYFISSEYSVPVRNVPITITSTSYTNYGLQISSQSLQEVSVTIEGDRNTVGSVKAEDIIVSPSLSTVTSPGTYELNLTASKANPLAAFTITSISPSSVTLKFDVSEQAMFSIETYISGINIPDEFITGTITTAPETITVWGPAEDVNRIDRVVVRDSLEGTQTETQTIRCNISYLDSEGNELKLNTVAADVQQAEVTIPVLKRGELPIRVEFVNVPRGFNTDTLRYTLSMHEVLVAGQASLIDTMNTSVVGYVDLSSLDPSVPVVFDLILPAGITNLTGNDTVTADFSESNLESKNINVTDLRFENIPTGYTAEYQQNSINSVTVVGPRDELESLQSTSVIGVVDFNEFTLQLGGSTAAVSFRIPSSDSCWVTGKHTALISVEADS